VCGFDQTSVTRTRRLRQKEKAQGKSGRKRARRFPSNIVSTPSPLSELLPFSFLSGCDKTTFANFCIRYKNAKHVRGFDVPVARRASGSAVSNLRAGVVVGQFLVDVLM
jgi:hypothetical protein